MQQGSGFLLVLAGLFFLWVVISGKFDLMESFFYQLFDIPLPQSETKQTQTIKNPQTPQEIFDSIFQSVGGQTGAPSQQVGGY